MKREFRVGEGVLSIDRISSESPRGLGLTEDGGFVNLKNGELIGGRTIQNDMGFTDIRISPKYIYGDNIDFRAVAGHELTHAYQYYTIPKYYIDKNYQERAAYRFTFDEYLKNGRFDSATRTMYGAMTNPQGEFWGRYPSEYKWPYLY